MLELLPLGLRKPEGAAVEVDDFDRFAVDYSAPCIIWRANQLRGLSGVSFCHVTAVMLNATVTR